MTFLASFVASSSINWSVWLGTPLILIVLFSVLGFFWRFARWTGEVDTDRKTLHDFMKEIRSDVKKILKGCLFPQSLRVALKTHNCRQRNL